MFREREGEGRDMVKDEMPGNFEVFTVFQAAGWVCYYVV